MGRKILRAGLDQLILLLLSVNSYWIVFFELKKIKKKKRLLPGQEGKKINPNTCVWHRSSWVHADDDSTVICAAYNYISRISCVGNLLQKIYYMTN